MIQTDNSFGLVWFVFVFLSRYRLKNKQKKKVTGKHEPKAWVLYGVQASPGLV